MAIDTTKKYQAVTVVLPIKVTPIESALLGLATEFAVANTLVKRNSDAVAYVARYGAGVHSTAVQSIPVTAHTAINFAAADFQTGTCWTIGAPTKIYAPVTGLYLVNTNITWASNATGIRSISLRQAGSIYRAQLSQNPITGSDHSMSLATILQLTAGDYMETTGYQSTAGALNVQYQAYLSAQMQMILL